MAAFVSLRASSPSSLSPVCKSGLIESPSYRRITCRKPSSAWGASKRRSVSVSASAAWREEAGELLSGGAGNGRIPEPFGQQNAGNTEEEPHDSNGWSRIGAPNEEQRVFATQPQIGQSSEDMQSNGRTLSKALLLLPFASLGLLVFFCLRPAVALGAVAAAKTSVKHLAALAGRAGEAFQNSFHGGAPLADAGLISSAWTGLAAGWLHTLSGPDHLAALAPLSIGRTKLESAAVGALWGCGHDVGQVLFGILFVLLEDQLKIDIFRKWGARVVGLTLMAIGAVGISEAQQQPIQCNEDDEECLAQPGAVVFSTKKKVFNLATFATGIVHGLQPDALLVVLPALAFPSKLSGSAFLLMFLVGTVMAMGSYTAFIGTVSERIHKRVPWLTQRLSLVASLIAIFVGVGILAGELTGLAHLL
eukprot:TRINITY_DN35600_c0_g1_i1.p1 TRINITY_DN35600_c0_g1~~TRINITY_DN35600_c0_g1_i1.p1  ORF type:complete len:419 (+),score=52.82 TRINITY_DN35600_c0_g1_i1:58-1314(+)